MGSRGRREARAKVRARVKARMRVEVKSEGEGGGPWPHRDCYRAELCRADARAPQRLLDRGVDGLLVRLLRKLGHDPAPRLCPRHGAHA